MDEELRKRNTDCVYFLASPLTCKKGSGCEFRHSEPARKNPRDCRYWFNGNCLNQICPFRHPPLDGKVSAASTTTPRASATSMASTFSAAGATLSRYKIPCYYFSQGYCAKGDKCPFMHGLAAVASTPEVHSNPLKAQTDQGIDNIEMGSVVNETYEAVQKQEGSNDHTLPTHTVSRLSNPSVLATELKRAANVEPSSKEEERSRRGNDRAVYMQELVSLSWQNGSKKEMKLLETIAVKGEHQFRTGRLQQGAACEELKQKGIRPVIWPREMSMGLDEPDQTKQELFEVDEPQEAYDHSLFNRSERRQHDLCHVSRVSLDVDRKESWVMSPAYDTRDLRHHLMKRHMTGNAHAIENQNRIETFQQRDHSRFKRPRQDDCCASVSKILPGTPEDFQPPKPLSVILKEKGKASRTVEGVSVSAYKGGKLLPSKVVHISGGGGDHGCFIRDDVAGRGFNQYHK